MTWDNDNQNHPHQPEQLHLETRIFFHYSSLEMRIEIRDVRCRTSLLIIRLRCELRITDLR
ncbi:GM23888 [Drosophila sechellia]|uniref:GM23888 n=1 Tax=Drosophila sechellia TaxID=7238 RepID=B4HIS6_DROSE|nr:GM23888 [Drosophila sechellia]